ncbi:hypothetical protein [Chitinophaga caseinilytica]|uniref:Uncharacterized protein n=1 Tax=Chitinophaga caseinilytica TaxID=2267521 RepID=A0ABZ2Z0F8_9BACT
MIFRGGTGISRKNPPARALPPIPQTLYHRHFRLIADLLAQQSFV